jgi:alpha-L-fucosidase
VATEPTPVLRAWEDLQYGMFVHFGLSTFVGDQFGRFEHPSTAYAPTDLDMEQWVRTAKDAGMKYVVLTVKHHYGHALWPKAHRIRLAITESVLGPTIWDFALYPPR